MAANPNPSNSPRLSPLNPNPNLTSAPNPYAQGLGPPFQLQKQAHSASARASNASGTGSTKKSGRGRGHSVSTVPVHLSEIPSGLTAATTGTNHSRSRSASVSGTSLPASPTLSPPVPVSGIHTHTAPTTPTLSPTTTENAQSQSQTHSRRSSWWRREFLSEATTTTTGTASASASHGHGFARPWYTTTNMAATAAASTTGSTASGRRHSVAGTPTAKEKEGAGLGGTVPVEQMENWDITRKRVAQAASSILGNSALMAHEVLLHSVDLFELAPVPGLSLAARTLLEIWDCVQEVDSNRLQCLRLTERCADILLSVRQEVYDAGDEVAEELRLGVERLTESFTQVHTLLIKQASRPFLKRYLKRDEISKQLAVCDVGLQEALGMFSLSIQIRILKQVQLAEARRQKDTEELLRSVVSAVSGHATPTAPMSPIFSSGSTATLTPTPVPQSRSSFPYAIPSPLSPTNSNAHSAVNLNDSNNHSLLLSRSSLPAPGYAYADLDSSRRKGGSESLQSLHIQGLHGLPPSSSHSSLALAEVEPAESEANLKQALSTFQWPKLPVPPSSGSHTPMPPLPSSASSAPISPGSTSSTPTPTGKVMPLPTVPSVSITPSSRPSTMGSGSPASGFGTGAGSLESPETETHKEKQKKKTPVAVPVQLIPTKSTIEAAKGVLEEIQHTQSSSNSGSAASSTPSDTTSAPFPAPNAIPPFLLPSPSSLPPSLVLPTLLSLTRHQTLLDAESDYADLRGIMREALRKGSDVEMIGVLLGGSRSRSEGFGVAGAAEGMGGEQGGSLGRLDAGEMAEAIKTLQRAHEAILERERWETLRGQAQSQAGQVPPPGKSTVTAGGRVPSLAQEPAAIASGDPSTSASDDVPGSMSTSKTITAISGTGNVEEGRPGLGRRTSSSLSTSSAIRSSMSMNALKRITKRMSLQSSVSASREASTSSPLNETSIVEEATEVEEDVGVDMAVVRKMGIGIGMIRKDSSGGSRLIRSKTTSSAVTTASTNDSILSQAGSGSSGSGSGVTTTSGSGSGYGSGGSHTKNDTLTLDKEFIESGIDALRRMSRPTKRRRGEGSIRDGMGMSQSSSVGIGLDRDGDGMRVLPSWTITRYEIDREEKIGIGFFSDVYKGTWRPPSVPSGPPSTSFPLSPPTSTYPPAPPSRTVAIKVLAETTPRALFLRETAIWKTLAHPNVLELFGASSAWGDPPWFFVSPYMGNGSLAEFLRGNAIRLNMDVNPHTNADGGEEENGNSRIRAASLTLPGYPGWSGGGLGSLVGARRHSPMQGAGALLPDAALGLGASAAHPHGSSPHSQTSDNGHTRHRSGSDSAAGTASPSSVVVGWASLGLAELEEIPKEWNLLRFMHEIAKGMEYLHSRGVLHGDLKASNVLVDDKIHCVISDFGQSEMRSEAYRISGTPPPHGTLRWQAPELMFGSLTQLTVEMDVYAFAICCTEVLSLGRMPWPFSNDDQVHNQVMSNQRPTVPNTPFTTPELVSLVQSCWATNPFYRPPFSKVASELKGIRKVFGIGFGGPATPGVEGYAYQQPPPPSIPSPDLRPIPLPPSRYQMTVPRTPPRDILNLTATALHAQHQGTPSSSNSNSSSSEDASFRTARDVSTSPHDREGGYEHRETTVPASLSLSASTSSANTVTPNAPKPSSESPFAPTGALPFSPTSTTTFSPTSSPFSPTIPPFSPTSPSAFSFPSSAGPSSFVPGYSYSGSSHAGFGYNNNSNYGVDITRGSGFNPSSISPGIAGTTAQGQLQLQMPETVIYTPSRPPSSTTSSIFTSTPSESQEEEAYDAHGGKTMAMEYDGYDSPPPANELLAEARNERRYRLLLVHDFHPSLTLPLWTPTPIALGAIGYLSKPKGEFITLFNAFNPQKSDSTLAKDLPSVHGYGKVSTGSQRQDKRNAAQRGLDAIAGLLTFKGRGGNVSKSVSRRYTFPLRAGHKTAYLCTETTMYRYVDNLDAPKKWFKANVDAILDVFGAQHHVQKEDLYFVIGTLDTPEHAVFVGHNHPDGQAHFNVFSSSKSHQPWGRFTTDTDTPFELGGPSYHEPVSGSPLSASKISPQGNYPWNTVLLARLRFKPDVLEPTSL